MKKLNLKKVVLSLATASMFGTSALASSVNVHSFEPAANPSFIYTEDAILSSQWDPSGSKSKGRIFFGAFYDFLSDPLVELNQQRTERQSVLVNSMNSLNLTLGYSLISTIQLGVTGMVSMVQLPDSRREFGIGDSRVFTKFRLNGDDDAVAFALMPEAFLPTGNRDLFLSNDSFGAGVRLVAERDLGTVTIAGNAGYRYSSGAVYRDLNRKQSLPLSLGALVPIGPRWAINGDVRGDLSLPFNSNVNPGSVYLGVRYRLPGDLIASVGGIAGALNNYASANYGMIAGLTLLASPQAKAEPVVPVAVKPAPAPVAPPVVVSAVEKKPRVVFSPKRLDITEEVKFKNAKADLTDSGMNLLDEVAKVLKQNKDHYKLIVIEGHTDINGTFAYNQKLSEDRAASVKEYLVSRGIPAKTLMTVGYGKTKMKKVAKGVARDAALAMNRRVEFKVMQ